MAAYRNSDIYAVIQYDFGFVSPDIVEQVEHDPYSLVPYQSSISLESLENDNFNDLLHTSENAGAVIVRYLFHSSPSEATMLLPKTNSAVYISTGLGNLARELATSYRI